MNEAKVESLQSLTILGLSWNHDSHAAIFKDGQILASVGEEPISKL